MKKLSPCRIIYRLAMSVAFVALISCLHLEDVYGQCASVGPDYSYGAWGTINPTCSQQGPINGMGAGSYQYYYQPAMAGCYMSFYVASNGANIGCATSGYYTSGDIGPYTNCLNTWGSSLAPAGTQYVRISTTSNGAWNTSSAVLYYQYTTPGTPAFTAAPTSLCINSLTGKVYTVGAVSAATSYVWTVSGAGATIASGQGSTSITVNYTTTGTATVSCYATNNGKCNSGTVTCNPVISALSNAGSFVTPLYLCSATNSSAGNTYTAGGSVVSQSITGYTGSITSWQYGTNCGGLSGVAGVGSTTAPWNCCFGYSSGPNSVTVTVTNGGCPSVSNCYTFAQNTASITGATPTATSICGGSTTTITPNGVGGAGASVTWWTGSGGTGSNLGTGTGSPSYILTGGGDQTYYARVTDACGNTAQASTSVALETTAPTITAPANISTYNSPNNGCKAAEVFAAPGVSDNCSGEQAGSVNPLPLPANLKLWVKGDAGVVLDGSGKVAEWRDLSGNGNNFKQATFANRPTKTTSDASFNGNTALTFTTSQYLTNITNIDGSGTSTYTMFTVSRLNGGTASRLISSASTNWLLGYWGGFKNQDYCNGWTYGSGASSPYNQTPGPDAVEHLYAVSSNGVNNSSTTFYDYGNPIVTNSNAPASPNGPGIIQLNGWTSGGVVSEVSSGEVAEVIYYNTVLTAAQRQIVEGYLAYKYNLPVPLASMQAYQTYATGAATTVNFIGTDESGNKAATTATATATAYPGPTVTPSTTSTCPATPITVTTTGMSPAGNCLNSAGSGDWLQASASTSASNLTIGTNWTIGTWVKFPLPANGAGSWNTFFRGVGYHHIIVERTTNTTGLYLGTYFGGFYPCTTIGSLNGAQGFDVSTLSAGWHHIAAVGTGGTTSFYVDGVFVGKAAAEVTNDNIVSIGNYWGGTQQTGLMDEVKIYNTALSQNAISNLMTQASTSATDPNWNNLVGYYKMDGSGVNSATGTAACSSCNGTLIGGANYSTTTGYYTYTYSSGIGGTFSPASPTTAESVTLSSMTNNTSGQISVTAAVSGCSSATSNSATITVNPNATISLNSGTTPQSVCYGVLMTPIVYNIGGGGTGAGAVNLPAGITGIYSGGIFTISGSSTAPGTYGYTVNTTGNCTQTSTTGTITIYPAVGASIGGGTSPICNGAAPGTLTATGSGGSGTGYTYLWYQNGTSTGVITSTYAPGTLTSTSSYYCAVTNTTCSQSANSNTITITVDATVGASIAGGSSPICINTAPGTFTATGSGGSGTGYTYLWYQNGTSTGVATSTYAPGNLSATSSYYCAITNTACAQSANSNTIAIVVDAAVSASINGGTSPICYGTLPGTFTATGGGGSGTGYTYLWYQNGSSTSVTTSTYAPAAITATSSYYCAITNTACSQLTNSNTITITVDAAVGASITGGTSPICNGAAPGTFTATGTGGSGTGYTYLWYQNGSSTGVTTSTYVPGNITATSSYYCAISNTTCSQLANSNTITIVVDAVVGAGISGGTTPICAGTSPGTITATGSGGTGSYTYLWYLNGSSTAITTNSYAPVLSGTSSIYCAVTSGSCGLANTSTTVITVDPQPTLSTLGNISICPGGTTSMSVTASGGISNATGFQWQYYNTSTNTWGNVTNGAPANVTYSVNTTGNTSTITITTTSGVAINTYQYQCTGTFNGPGCTPSVSSNTGILTITSQPAINGQPGTTLLCQGGTGTLTVATTGGVGASYQWQYYNGVTYANVTDNTPSGITYTGSGSANPLSITAGGSSATGTFSYKVIISFSGNGCTASLTSAAGSALVASPPAITSQPATTTPVCNGGSASLNIGTSGGIFLNNQWQYYNGSTWNNVVNGTPAGISYSGTSPLVISTTNGTTPPGSYQYQCVVSSAGSNCNPVTSHTATVVVNPTPNSFTPTVSSNPVCITATGGGTNIQLNSQTGVSYQLQTTAPANIGSPVSGNGSSINLPTGSVAATTTYQVLATATSGGCTYTSPTTTIVAVSPDIAVGAQLAGDHYTFGTIGSPALPAGFASPNNANTNHWTLATSNPASSGSYAYYDGTGNTSPASTGAYIQTPVNASATTPLVDLTSAAISTLGFSNISVQWAAQKSAGYTGTVVLSYSIDGGSSFTPLTFTDVQANVTGSPWMLVNNTVQVKLPALAGNQASVILKWSANPATDASYYSMNDIGVYGLGKINNCAGTSVSLSYLNTSCSVNQYSIGTSATTWPAWTGLAPVTNASISGSPLSLTIPAGTIAGTYDVDFSVNDGAGHSSGVVSFPVTTDPAINVTAALDNCSCNNTGSMFGNVIMLYASGGTGTYYFSSPAVIDSLTTTIDGSGSGYAGSLHHNGVKAVFWAKADGNTHTYTVNDGQCAVSATKKTQATKPTAIPFGNATGVPSGLPGAGGGNNISGSFNNSGTGDPAVAQVNGNALTCHQTADFGNTWVTYQVNNLDASGNPVAGDSTNNKAVVEINNNGVNLDSVSVSVYRDANLPVVPNAATGTTACAGYPMYGMERHFMFKSTQSNGPNAFHDPVGVRLYFSDAEFEDLKYWTMYTAAHATGESAGCAYLDTVTNLNSIYVTKYTGSSEDGDYTNNSPSGLYRLFGKNAANSGNSALSAIDGGQATLNTGGATNLHYVQFNVTEFSEFWLGGSQDIEALPVEMIYLEAEALNNDSIQVRWATATEINNREFDVERSADGNTWSAIGVVAGHGNSTVENAYVYNDVNVAPNIRYYYRLKQIDNNGNYQYTNIVQAMITGSGTFMVMNFVPNPTSGNTQLTVVTAKAQDISVDFYDMLGQKVYSATEQLTAGSNKIDFSLQRFAAGTYSAVVTTENQLYTKKIVVTGR